MPFVTIQLQLSEPARAEVDALRKAASDPMLGVSVPHCTLLPPQRVASTDWPEALAVLWNAARASSRFSIRLGSVDYWADRRLLFLGVLTVEPVIALHRRLQKAPLQPDRVLPYAPHVTLALGIDPEPARQWCHALSGFETETEIAAVHTRLRLPDRTWTTAASFPLRTDRRTRSPR